MKKNLASICPLGAVGRWSRACSVDRVTRRNDDLLSRRFPLDVNRSNSRFLQWNFIRSFVSPARKLRTTIFHSIAIVNIRRSVYRSNWRLSLLDPMTTIVLSMKSGCIAVLSMCLLFFSLKHQTFVFIIFIYHPDLSSAILLLKLRYAVAIFIETEGRSFLSVTYLLINFFR